MQRLDSGEQGFVSTTRALHRARSVLAELGPPFALCLAACAPADDTRAPPAPDCVEAGCKPRGGGGPGGGGTATDGGLADGPATVDVGDGSIVTVNVTYTVR